MGVQHVDRLHIRRSLLSWYSSECADEVFTKVFVGRNTRCLHSIRLCASPNGLDTSWTICNLRRILWIIVQVIADTLVPNHSSLRNEQHPFSVFELSSTGRVTSWCYLGKPRMSPWIGTPFEKAMSLISSPISWGEVNMCADCR